ncbi:hypothetical protein FQA39_LY16449 [Lamprigera yunnana]|nr:hypothetical protein FQA39_LY16449 [Lamprigera yunnana]
MNCFLFTWGFATAGFDAAGFASFPAGTTLAGAGVAGCLVAAFSAGGLTVAALTSTAGLVAVLTGTGLEAVFADAGLVAALEDVGLVAGLPDAAAFGAEEMLLPQIGSCDMETFVECDKETAVTETLIEEEVFEIVIAEKTQDIEIGESDYSDDDLLLLSEVSKRNLTPETEANMLGELTTFALHNCPEILIPFN